MLRKICSVMVMVFLIAAATGFTAPVLANSAGSPVTNLTMNTDSPAKYDMFEATFDVAADYSVPEVYDPSAVDIVAHFVTPAGKTETVPAFYKANTSPQWAVRYSPRQTGGHSFRIEDRKTGEISSGYSFTAVEAGDNRGFIYTEKDRFIDSYGKQFTLFGTNFAWALPSEFAQGMAEYKNANMNFMRVWLNPFWAYYGLEWGPTVREHNGITIEYQGIGNYQLENADRLDYVFSLAEDNDIYMMLSLFSFGDLNYNWDVNAYNKANGGPCSYDPNTDITDLLTNPEAIKYQKNLQRYIFARWGYSRALGMLEYWNEMDNQMSISQTDRANWHQIMATEWKAMDFYKTPLTTSYAWEDHSSQPHRSTWDSLPMLDVANKHYYSTKPEIIDLWAEQLNWIRSKHPGNSPVFMGESGISEVEEPTAKDFRYIHDGIWSPLFRAGAAGANLFWRTNSTVNSFNLPEEGKRLYTICADFVQPFEEYLPYMAYTDYGLQSNNTKVGGYRDFNRALLWINNTQANYLLEEDNIPAVSGMSFTLAGMEDWLYDITYLNTYTGEVVASETVSANDGKLVLNIPEFKRDIAVKAVMQPGGPQPIEAQIENVSAANGTVTITLTDKPTEAPKAADFTATVSINGGDATAIALTDYSYDGNETVTYKFVPFSMKEFEQSVVVAVKVGRYGPMTAQAFIVEALPPVDPDNLLLNPGFETVDGSGRPVDWQPSSRFSGSDTVRRSGNAALKVQNTNGSWFSVYQDVDGAGGNTYHFTGYAFIEDGITYNPNSALRIRLQYLNADGAVIRTDAGYDLKNRATGTWHPAEITSASPAGTAKVRVDIRIEGAYGTVYFDDFSLKEEEGIKHSVIIGSMENGTVTADKQAAAKGEIIALTVTPDENYRLAAGSLKVNGKAIIGTSFAMPEENATITAAFERMLSPGTAETTVSAGDTVALNQPFEVTLGIHVQENDILNADITLAYNSDLFEYVSATVPEPGLDIAGSNSQNPGTVRLLLAGLGAEDFITGNVPLLYLTFKAKGEVGAGEIKLTRATLVNTSGIAINAALSSKAIAVVADKSALSAAIENAQRIYAQAEEGNIPGQYPAGSKAVLKAAIDHAMEVLSDAAASQAQIDSEAAALQSAVDIFIQSEIKLPGDLNGDYVVDILDLYVVSVHYGKNTDSPDWSSARAADINHDGKIDMEDLLAVVREILK